jgi:hypothetical protein
MGGSSSRDQSGPLAYAAPGVVNASSRRQRVLSLLTARDRIQIGTIAVRLICGAPLTMIGPLFTAAFLAAIAARLRWEAMPSFGTLLLLCAAVMVPSLMWYRRRLEGSVFANNPIERPSSFGEYELGRQKGAAILFLEFSLLGPEMLWSAIDAITGRRQTRGADAELAATLVDELLTRGEGAAVAELAADRSPADVRRAVAFLKRHDWVGVSADGRRVWVLSDRARQVNDR